MQNVLCRSARASHSWTSSRRDPQQEQKARSLKAAVDVYEQNQFQLRLVDPPEPGDLKAAKIPKNGGPIPMDFDARREIHTRQGSFPEDE